MSLSATMVLLISIWHSAQDIRRKVKVCFRF
jgi:hypothetical protein